MATTINMALAAHYVGRIYPGVEVNGIPVGGLDRDDARHMLARRISNYSVRVNIGDNRHRVTPAELGARYDLEATLDTAFAAGRSQWWPIASLWHSARARSGYAYRLDQAQLQTVVNKLADTGSAKPIDADLVMKDGKAEVVADKSGLVIDRQQLSQALLGALSSRTTKLSLVPEMTPAEVRADNLVGVKLAAEQVSAVPVELTYNGRLFRPGMAVVATWLTFPKEGVTRRVEVDPERTKLYLAKLARQIDIKPVTKHVTMINGEIKGQVGGVDGLAVDQDKLAAQLAAQVRVGNVVRLEVPTKAVAYKTEYNKTITLAYGRYLEVNLTTQRLYAYQDGQLAMVAPITSGAKGYGFGTIQGLFSIYHKARAQWLDGRSLGWNYRVYVDYWMPFSGAYGLHDADWRSTFGGPDYYWNGSHGCVNMAKSTAAWIWDWAPVGTPVWVHS